MSAGNHDRHASSSDVHIVVTCSNRKSRPVPAELRLGAVRERRPTERFTSWISTLANSDEPVIQALDLYAGEHWQIARTLPSLVGGRKATLWICSAGYGLVGAEAPVRPYAATFTAGDPDSVGRTGEEAQEWWTRLGSWDGPVPDQPRSFTALATAHPNTVIIAVLSAAYQRACAPDLFTAAQTLTSPSQLSVIGSPAGGGLLDRQVAALGSMRTALGGSLLSLNVRLAAHLLAEPSSADLHTANLRAVATQLAASSGPVLRPLRRQLADDEVREFIATRAAAGPVTRTPLLRELRSAGQACEQSRFARLFGEVMESS